MTIHKKELLARVGAVTSAVALVIAGSWYTVRRMEQSAKQVSSAASNGQVIILDAGHGGMDGGCTSAAGDVEKNINLAILLDLRDMLRASGYSVLTTRDTDRSIHDDGVEGIANQKSSDMDNRLELFNSVQDAICISIHQNQFTDPQYSGAQMFYSDANSKNAALAQILQNQFVSYLQPDNQRETKLCGKELFLCYYSKNPTVMAECGFLSNPEEAALLITEDYQQKVAFTIYSALIQYCAEAGI
ncbi:MAG: N-acetylmuramoyl-L-alanine amidase [Oscillospiraceae bacterium]|nr:N-acetylmuramoyl-L-alanine amidase [Oscillospiraceae bacterium]